MRYMSPINYLDELEEERTRLAILAKKGAARQVIRCSRICRQLANNTITVRNYMRLRSHINQHRNSIDMRPPETVGEEARLQEEESSRREDLSFVTLAEHRLAIADIVEFVRCCDRRKSSTLKQALLSYIRANHPYE